MSALDDFARVVAGDLPFTELRLHHPAVYYARSAILEATGQNLDLDEVAALLNEIFGWTDPLHGPEGPRARAEKATDSS